MWKKRVSIKKNKFDLQKAMKINFKVKMKVTVEIPVEKYFRNCTDLLENFVYFNDLGTYLNVEFSALSIAGV